MVACPEPAVTLHYVTNLPRTLSTGGFSGMNVAMLDALEQVADVRYVGPIAPPSGLRERNAYRVRRALGALRMPGVRPPFVTYSARRLARIARDVAVALGDRTDAPVVFHGFTPWIATRPSAPYVAWSDCTFRDYVSIYHDRDRFAPLDLARIEEAEARWLRRASRVLFTSDWAAARATQDYALDPSRVEVVGFYGAVQPPAADTYAGGHDLAFISTDFAAKGGTVVAEAFARVRTSWPSARLLIVGDPPPAGMTDAPGVVYTGFLRKEVPDEAARFRDILAQSRAVVLPTQADISPLLLVEAASFGCPAVASHRFAIPEIVRHGETGLLLDRPGDPADVADAMASVLGLGETAYGTMRATARERAGRLFSRERFHARVRAVVEPVLAVPRGQASDLPLATA